MKIQRILCGTTRIIVRGRDLMAAVASRTTFTLAGTCVFWLSVGIIAVAQVGRTSSPVDVTNRGGQSSFQSSPLSESEVELAASAACSVGVPSAQSASGYVCKRNILLIIADDVGVDQIPRYYGYYQTTSHKITVTESGTNPKAQMNTISQLGMAGVTFLNAWSSPVCSPSRACLYTGNHSFRHGVYRPKFPELPESFIIDGTLTTTTTIAKVLKDSKYANALFGKWHLGECNGPVHFDWDRHYGALGGELKDYYNWEKEKVEDDVFHVVSIGDDDKCKHNSGTLPEYPNNYATTVNKNDAVDWIKAQNGPWMATVAFNAPHDPWEWPPADCAYKDRAEESDRAKYRSMLECLDRSIGELLAGIPEAMLEQTTIIFMGDNGTPKEITDHFSDDRYPKSSADGFSHYKDTVYEGGINVPLIIADGDRYLHRGEESSWTKGRGRVVSPGRFNTDLVQTLDIFATCAEIGRGVKETGFDSVSMVPYLSSASASPQRNYIFAEVRSEKDGKLEWTGCGSTGWDVAIRNDTYKLIVHDYGSSSELRELYDPTTDRWEETPITSGPVSVITINLLKLLDDLLTTGEDTDCY